MLQTEFINDYRTLVFQNKINTWLAKHPKVVVKDIKLSCSTAMTEDVLDGDIFTALIIYETNTPAEN